uniref:Uncharacterized protein n=1 Tax=Triticum aestivum TaxID=4565 RepID=A0A3B6DGU1_WHEAT
MDHSIPYSRGYASDSDDEGPDEQVDEEGFTVKEAEAFEKVFGRDHRTTLFKVSLADEAVVDGGQGISLGVRRQALTVIWKTTRTGLLKGLSSKPSWN